MARKNKKPSPLLDKAVMQDTFAVPAKKARQAIAVTAQRLRYIQLSIDAGIPPRVAQIVCNRYSTPKKINDILSRWTGRCYKLGVPLTDAGTKENSSAIVTRDGHFISHLSVKFQGSFTDSELLGLCTLVYNRHHASSTTTHLGSVNRTHHDNSNTSHVSGAAVQPYGAGKQSVPLGLF